MITTWHIRLKNTERKIGRINVKHCREWRQQQSDQGRPDSLAQYLLQNNIITAKEYRAEYHCARCDKDIEGRGCTYPEPIGLLCGDC